MYKLTVKFSTQCEKDLRSLRTVDKKRIIKFFKKIDTSRFYLRSINSLHRKNKNLYSYLSLAVKHFTLSFTVKNKALVKVIQLSSHSVKTNFLFLYQTLLFSSYSLKQLVIYKISSAYRRLGIYKINLNYFKLSYY